MNLDVRKIAQDLINEIEAEVGAHRARAEGVALLYGRIQEAIDAHVKSLEIGKEEADVGKQDSEPSSPKKRKSKAK